MKNNFISIIFGFSSLVFAPVDVTAQSPVNNILLGKQDRASLQQPPFSDWFNTNYDSYLVDSFTCKFISPLLSDKHITIFMGTWCGDSRRKVPRFLKMLDCCEFPMNQLTLIMVGNSDSLYKKSPQHEEAGRNIVRVPTIIIEQKGAEVGRIIEFPVTSLEKDLLSILRKENYMPNYHQMKAEGR
jgi:hypothetical protein